MMLSTMIIFSLTLALFIGLIFHISQAEKAKKLFIQSCIERRNERVMQLVLMLQHKNRKLNENETDEALQLFREELKLMGQTDAKQTLQRYINQVNTYDQRGYAIGIFSNKAFVKAFG